VNTPLRPLLCKLKLPHPYFKKCGNLCCIFYNAPRKFVEIIKTFQAKEDVAHDVVKYIADLAKIDNDWFRYVLQQLPFCPSDAEVESLMPFNIDRGLLLQFVAPKLICK